MSHAVEELHYMGEDHNEVLIGIFRHDKTIKTLQAAHMERMYKLDKYKELLETVAAGECAAEAIKEEEKKQEAVVTINSLIRGATLRQNKLVRCYNCGDQIAYQNYQKHVDGCAKDIENTLKRLFHNPLRTMPRPPPMRLPAADSDDIDEYNLQCIEALNASRLPCERCGDPYFIHELRSHGAVCIGRAYIRPSSDSRTVTPHGGAIEDLDPASSSAACSEEGDPAHATSDVDDEDELAQQQQRSLDDDAVDDNDLHDGDASSPNAQADDDQQQQHHDDDVDQPASAEPSGTNEESRGTEDVQDAHEQ